MIELTRALLRSGASIAEMNVVRKHISQIKGGRLARAIAPARLMTLAISDVPGDDPASIGSGPTVGDASTQADARDILAKYKLPLPPAVDVVLADPKNLPVRPDDPAVAASAYIIAATADTALAAAAKVAEGAGLTVHNLGGKLEGEARDLARRHADFALSLQANGATGPQLILSGGETSVTVTGDGVGGRNGEYALAMHIALAGAPGIYGLACDTDGIDGMSEFAGAMVTPDTAARAKVNGIDAVAGLANNDCYGFFGRVGGAIKTGPTGTNVNDFRAILVT